MARRRASLRLVTWAAAFFAFVPAAPSGCNPVPSVARAPVSSQRQPRVQYKEEVCSVGGSSCAGAPRRIWDVRVGDLDGSGNPMLETGTTCETAEPFQPVVRFEGRVRRSCDSDTFTLRRSQDGKIYIVSFLDPDDTERVVVAFSRAATGRTPTRDR